MVSAASSTPTITIYDQETAGTSVKVIDTFTPVSATNYNFYDGINCTNGIYVVIGGTVYSYCLLRVNGQPSRRSDDKYRPCSGHFRP